MNSTEGLDKMVEMAVLKLDAGDVPSAAGICDHIISFNPNYIESRILKAVIGFSTGRFGDAMKDIHHCLRTRPEYETGQFNNKFGKTYLDLAKDLETVTSKLIKDHMQQNQDKGATNSIQFLLPAFHFALALHIQGRFDEARKYYNLSLSNSVIMKDRVGTIINLCAALEEQAGNKDEARKWVDLDKYPLVYEPGESIAGMSVKEFNKGLYAEIISSKKYQPWPEAQSNNWYVASDLSRNNAVMGPFLRKLEAIFVERAERVMDQIAEVSPVPDHPCFGRRPKNYRIEMFASGLKAGGHAGPHVHSDAFMTGNYYVKVPQVDDAENNDRGCVVYGKTLFHGAIGFENKCRTIRPVEGMMLAWPSYLSHATIPCETDQARMVVGYDIEPDVG